MTAQTKGHCLEVIPYCSIARGTAQARRGNDPLTRILKIYRLLLKFRVKDLPNNNKEEEEEEAAAG